MTEAETIRRQRELYAVIRDLDGQEAFKLILSALSHVIAQAPSGQQAALRTVTMNTIKARRFYDA